MSAVGINKYSLPNAKLISLCLVVVLLFFGFIFSNQAQGAEVQDRYLELSDALPGDSAIYNVGFTLATTQSLGSIEVDFCSNSPLIGASCTAPTGFNVLTATISGESGVTDFTISPATPANSLILTRTASAITAPLALTYTLSGVTNPSISGPYYARIRTFASPDASGSMIDYGGIAYDITQNISITTTVPPYIDICIGTTITDYDCDTATGNYLNLGDLSPSAPSSATTQIVMAANAANGYSLWATGTTLTSGNNIIPSIGSADIARPGVAQFGINLVANNTPQVGSDVNGPGIGTPTSNYSQPDFFQYSSNSVIASSTGPADYNDYTVSYLVDIPKDQAPGVYSTTLTFMALGNF